MLSHQEMIGLQAEKHDLIDEEGSPNVEQFVLLSMHSAAYVHASRLVEGKAVLDIGCNTGYGTNILSARTKSIVGVDVSGRAIEMAKRKYGTKLSFQLVDGERLPFDDGSFDVVTGFQLIEHLVEYDSFMNEVKRVLAPGGIAVFTTPNSLLRLDPGMKPWNEFHVREFNSEELQETLAKHFDEVRILGLTASAPLYAIEAGRVDRARRVARVAASGGTINLVRSTLRNRVKSLLSAGAVEFIKGLDPSGKRSRKFDEIRKNYGVDDFRYRTDDLDEVLDFMAICSNSDVTSYAALIED
jgi:2-polyprenyl-3-methyl-5-hydroxy-6-metoxy-1,4-benzoquinol methylase